MESQKMFNRSPKYHVRILRFWAEFNREYKGTRTWRFILENPETGERRSITDTERLLALLKEEVTNVIHDHEGEEP